MIRKGRTAPPPIRHDHSGQPSKYKEEYKREVIRLGQKGFTLFEMSEHFDVSYNTLINWAKKYPEFREAVSKALTFCKAYYDSLAREAVETDNAKFQDRTYRLILMQNFGFSEKFELSGNFTGIGAFPEDHPKEITWEYNQDEMQEFIQEVIAVGIDPISRRINKDRPEQITTQEEQITDAILEPDEDDIKITSQKTGGRQVSRFKAIN